MKCVICKHGSTKPGTSTLTFERDGATYVVKDVPAEVCDNCGEKYVSSEVSAHLLQQLERTAAQGVQVDVRSYRAGEASA